MSASWFHALALSAILLLSACAGGERDTPAPPAIRPRAGGPITLTGATPRDTQQCYADLSAAGVRFSPLPDRDYGSGCVVLGAVQLLDIGVPVAGLKAIRCPAARAMIGWIRHGVRPAARQMLGSDVVKIDSFGTYACRGIVGGGARSAGRVSEHGLANAVDIAAFVLADGRRISIERDWNGDDADKREFLRVIQRSACKRFVTTLTPDYNAAHYNHLHLDMGGRPLCR
ncbi:extensin [Sphingomonas sp. Leaf407]|uniref:extensin family protein n=1 Tax=unclassified Sphingomonas TaxID=196159 RepID=UPI0006F2DB06|nr:MULTISPECIES: extensin family protein [unclassified Sphingomonas]KQN35598.1 extensin [Sphingomonas sp. Leaf42]KQT26465.1 extensin [Sphingomonas sp. Leaf407]